MSGFQSFSNLPPLGGQRRQHDPFASSVEHSGGADAAARPDDAGTTPAEDPIRDLVIVGGGSTGWMAAALLARALPKACRVRVIQPPGEQGIGVGEATIPSILRLLENVGVDEADWMRRCQATYKLGIRFVDWHQMGQDYWHPFGICGARIDQADLFHDWLVQWKHHGLKQPYSTFSLHWAAAMAGKSPHPFAGFSPIADTRSYAFHLSAVGLAEWLREVALASGAEEIVGTVDDVILRDSESVAAVVLQSGTRIEGDFFFDCSGFRSRLMGEALGGQWIDWTDRLLCDGAVAVSLPASRIVPSYTEATALSSGWFWRIPLADRVGCGYVFSTAHTSRQSAWEELAAAIGLDPDGETQPRFLEMRIGRQETFWRGNVLALGLAAGFVEPLESTGLHLSQIAIEWFLDHFPSVASGSKHAAVYNRVLAPLYDEVSDFVHLHYLLSRREDSEFWRDARATPLSPALQERMAIYDESGRLGPLLGEAFPETSYYHLLCGNNRLPRHASMTSLAKDSVRIQEILKQIQQQNQSVLRSLPLHEEHLDWIHAASEKAV